MRPYLLAASCTLFAAPNPAHALSPITIGITGGTLGIGPEASLWLNPLIALRASATFLNVSASGNTASYHYSGHAYISNFGGTIDLHPFANGFRLSAGVRATKHNHVSFSGLARGNRTFMGMSYTPDQVGPINGDVHAKAVSPLATLGYVKTTLIGFTISLDAGVMFHGRPVAYDFSASGELGTNPYAAAEYASQQQHVQNDVNSLKYYPIAQLGIGYRF